MRIACLSALFLVMFHAPPLVRASAVYKCASSDGRTAYQSEACARGERTVARWEAVADPLVVPTSTAATPARSERVRAASASRRRGSTRTSTLDSCAAAKERRDAIERQVGLARTYELLSALQREVYDACK